MVLLRPHQGSIPFCSLFWVMLSNFAYFKELFSFWQQMIIFHTRPLILFPTWYLHFLFVLFFFFYFQGLIPVAAWKFAGWVQHHDDVGRRAYAVRKYLPLLYESKGVCILQLRSCGPSGHDKLVLQQLWCNSFPAECWGLMNNGTLVFYVSLFPRSPFCRKTITLIYFLFMKF